MTGRVSQFYFQDIAALPVFFCKISFPEDVFGGLHILMIITRFPLSWLGVGHLFFQTFSYLILRQWINATLVNAF